MKTQCTGEQLEFHPLGRRWVSGRFDGGRISSDAGGVLLREVDKRTGVTARVARCFVDYRNPASVEHNVHELVSQRLYAIALGYEDLNDHDALRGDALLSLLVGKRDVTGDKRIRERHRGYAVGECEYAEPHGTRRPRGGGARPLQAHRCAPGCVRRVIGGALCGIPFRGAARDMARPGCDRRPAARAPGRAVSSKATTVTTAICRCTSSRGEHLLCARLRASNQDASAGSVEELERIVLQIRRHWPRTRINIRGDSGFCRESIMEWCEANDVGFVLGLARNRRLVRALGLEMRQARSVHRRTGKPARRFRDFTYRTRKSWSRSRRVVGKAEYLSKGENPRFVVCNLSPRKAAARRLYEKLYCARGEMENRIKEQQLDLFADRTSAHTIRANQLRLYFASFAYVLMHALRRLGTRGTRVRPCPVLDAAAEALEAGRSAQDHGPAGVAVVLAGLSLCQDLYPGCCRTYNNILCGIRPDSLRVFFWQNQMTGTPPRASYAYTSPSTPVWAPQGTKNRSLPLLNLDRLQQSAPLRSLHRRDQPHLQKIPIEMGNR